MSGKQLGTNASLSSFSDGTFVMCSGFNVTLRTGVWQVE